MAKKTENISAVVDRETREQLEHEAMRDDVSVAHVIRRAIRLYLQEKEEKV